MKSRTILAPCSHLRNPIFTSHETLFSFFSLFLTIFFKTAHIPSERNVRQILNNGLNNCTRGNNYAVRVN